MIRDYPELPAEDVQRQGKTYVFCDVSTCDAADEVTDIEVFRERRGDVRVGTMPEGWGTSDPDGNALAGAAQFCPTHATRLPPRPEPDAPEPVEPDVPPADDE